VAFDTEDACILRPLEDALRERALEHAGEEGQDIDLHRRIVTFDRFLSSRVMLVASNMTSMRPNRDILMLSLDNLFSVEET
jgi:hypothetical protein